MKIPKNWLFKEKSKFISTDLINWHCQIFNQDDQDLKKKPNILLIHGTGGSLHSWQKMVEPLKKESNLYLVDLPDHGLTENLKENNFSLVNIAKQLSLLIKKLKINKFEIVVGHSAGVAIAQELFLTKTVGINEIIGINPSLVPPPTHFNLALNPIISTAITSKLSLSFFSNIIEKTPIIDILLDSTGSTLEEEQKQKYKEIFSQKKHVKGALKFMASTDLNFLLSRANFLKCKIKFIAGKNDKWVAVKKLRAIKERYFPKATFIEISGGHLLNETHQDYIIYEILNTINLTKLPP